MPNVTPRLVVEIFEHPGYGGRAGYLIYPQRTMAEAGFPNGIRSARVYRGPGFGAGPNYRAVLFEQQNFAGRKLVLAPGYYPNLLDMSVNYSGVVGSVNFAPDVDLAGPTWGTIPVTVEVFDDVGFRGRKATILRDVANTHTTLGMADTIMSVRVTKGPDFPSSGAKVRLYEHIDFEGSYLEVVLTNTTQRKEIPDLSLIQMVGGQYASTYGRSISSVQIEGWASSGEFKVLVFNDEFGDAVMKPTWQWVAPTGGGVWSRNQGYLEMQVQPGRDLWHGNPPGQGGNMDAPRLLMEVSGDFAIETRIPVTPQLKEHGGLLVWKNPGRFLRLEKTSGPHGFAGDVRFEQHVNRVFSLVGRGQGLVNVRHLFLRIERKGNQFTGFAGPDGENWQNCGSTNVAMGDPVQVGLHALCPGSIPPTVTRFDYFRIYKRTGEGRAIGATPKAAGLEQQMSQTQRLLMMRRFMRQ
jgi:hypothetical protein